MQERSVKERVANRLASIRNSRRNSAADISELSGINRLESSKDSLVGIRDEASTAIETSIETSQDLVSEAVGVAEETAHTPVHTSRVQGEERRRIPQETKERSSSSHSSELGNEKRSAGSTVRAPKFIPGDVANVEDESKASVLSEDYSTRTLKSKVYVEENRHVNQGGEIASDLYNLPKSIPGDVAKVEDVNKTSVLSEGYSTRTLKSDVHHEKTSTQGSANHKEGEYVSNYEKSSSDSANADSIRNHSTYLTSVAAVQPSTTYVEENRHVNQGGEIASDLYNLPKSIPGDVAKVEDENKTSVLSDDYSTRTLKSDVPYDKTSTQGSANHKEGEYVSNYEKSSSDSENADSICNHSTYLTYASVAAVQPSTTHVEENRHVNQGGAIASDIYDLPEENYQTPSSSKFSTRSNTDSIATEEILQVLANATGQEGIEEHDNNWNEASRVTSAGRWNKTKDSIVSEAGSSKRDYKQEMRKWRSRCASLKKVYDSEVAARKEASNLYEEALRELKGLRVQLQEYSNDNILTDKEKEISRLTRKLNSHYKENMSLKRDVEEKEQQVENLRVEFETKKDVEEKQTEEVNELNQKIDTLRYSLDESSNTCSRLEGDIGDEKQKTEKAQKQLMMAKEENSLVRQQIEELKEQVASRNEQLENLKQHSQKCDAELEESKANSSFYQQRVAEMKNRISELENELEETRRSRDQIEHKLAEEENKFKIKEDESAAYSDKIKELRNETADWKEMLDARDKQIAEVKENYENDLRTAKDESEYYKNRLSELERKSSLQVDDLEQLRRKTKDYEDQLSELRRHFHDREVKLQHVNEEIEVYKKQLSQAQEEESILRSLLRQQESGSAKLRSELEKNKEKLRGIEADQEKLPELEGEVEKLSNEVSLKEKEIKRLSSLYEEQYVQNEEFRIKEQKAIERVQLSEEDNKMLLQKLEIVEDKLKEINPTGVGCCDMVNCLNKVQELIHQQEQTSISLKQEVETGRNELEQLYNEKNSVAEATEELREQRNKLQTKLESTEKRLEEKNVSINDLQEKLSGLQTSLENAKNELGRLKNDLEEERDQNKKLNEDYMELQTRFDESSERLYSTEQALEDEKSAHMTLLKDAKERERHSRNVIHSFLQDLASLRSVLVELRYTEECFDEVEWPHFLDCSAQELSEHLANGSFIESMKQCFDQLCSSIWAVETKLAKLDKDRSRAQDHVRTLEESKNQIALEKCSLQQSLDGCKQENDKALQLRNQELDSLRQELEDAKRKNSQLEDKVDYLQADKDDMSNVNERLNDRLHRLDSTLRDLKGRYSSMSSNVRIVEHKLTQSKEALERTQMQYEDRIAKLLQEWEIQSQDMRADTNNRSKEVSRLSEELRNEYEEVKSLQNTVQEYEERLERQASELRDMECKNSQNQQHVERLNKAKQSEEERCRELENLLDNVKEERSNIERSRETIEEQLREIREEVEIYKARYDQSILQLGQIEKERNELREHLLGVHSKESEMAMQVRQQKSELRSKGSKLWETLSQLKNEVKEMKDSFVKSQDDSETVLRTVMHSMHSVIDSVHGIQKEKHDASSAYQRKIDDYSTYSNDLERACDGLRDTIVGTFSNVNSLVSDIASVLRLDADMLMLPGVVPDSAKEVETIISSNRKKVMGSFSSLMAMKDAPYRSESWELYAEDLVSRLKEKNDANKELVQSIVEYQSHVHELKNRVTTKDNEMAELRSHLDVASASEEMIDNAVDTINELKDELDVYRKKQNEYEHKFENMERQCSQYKDETAKLHSEIQDRNLKLERLEEEKKIMSEQHSNTRKEIEKAYKEEFETLKQDRDAARSEAERIREQFSSLQTYLSETIEAFQTHKSRVQTLSTEKESLKQHVSRLESLLHSTGERESEDRYQTGEYPSQLAAEREVQRLRSVIEVYEHSVSDIQSQVQKLSKTLQGKDAEIQKITRDKGEAENKLSQSEYEKDHVWNQLQLLNSTVSHIYHKVVELPTFGFGEENGEPRSDERLDEKGGPDGLVDVTRNRLLEIEYRLQTSSFRMQELNEHVAETKDELEQLQTQWKEELASRDVVAKNVSAQTEDDDLLTKINNQAKTISKLHAQVAVNEKKRRQAMEQQRGSSLRLRKLLIATNRICQEIASQENIKEAENYVVKKDIITRVLSDSNVGGEELNTSIDQQVDQTLSLLQCIFRNLLDKLWDKNDQIETHHNREVSDGRADTSSHFLNRDEASMEEEPNVEIDESRARSGSDDCTVNFLVRQQEDIEAQIRDLHSRLQGATNDEFSSIDQQWDSSRNDVELGNSILSSQVLSRGGVSAEDTLDNLHHQEHGTMTEHSNEEPSGTQDNSHHGKDKSNFHCVIATSEAETNLGIPDERVYNGHSTQTRHVEVSEASAPVLEQERAPEYSGKSLPSRRRTKSSKRRRRSLIRIPSVDNHGGPRRRTRSMHEKVMHKLSKKGVRRGGSAGTLSAKEWTARYSDLYESLKRKKDKVFSRRRQKNDHARRAEEAARRRKEERMAAEVQTRVKDAISEYADVFTERIEQIVKMYEKQVAQQLLDYPKNEDIDCNHRASSCSEDEGFPQTNAIRQEATAAATDAIRLLQQQQVEAIKSGICPETAAGLLSGTYSSKVEFSGSKPRDCPSDYDGERTSTSRDRVHSVLSELRRCLELLRKSGQLKPRECETLARAIGLRRATQLDLRKNEVRGFHLHSEVPNRLSQSLAELNSTQLSDPRQVVQATKRGT